LKFRTGFIRVTASLRLWLGSESRTHNHKYRGCSASGFQKYSKSSTLTPIAATSHTTDTMGNARNAPKQKDGNKGGDKPGAKPKTSVHQDPTPPQTRPPFPLPPHHSPTLHL
jgi:hypothetical protein